jgi:hypothetical protein
MSDKDSEEYLRLMLRLDPYKDSWEIVARRQSRLLPDNEVIAATTVSSQRPIAEIREDNETKLARIRERFWQLSTPQLTELLLEVDTASVPDMQQYVEQLLKIDMLRPQFDALEKKVAPDTTIVDVMRAVVIQHRVAAASLRSQFHADMRQRGNCHAIKKSIYVLGQKFPDLYALEHEWLAALMTVRCKSKWWWG